MQSNTGHSLRDYVINTSTIFTPGQHLLIDFWGAQHLKNLDAIESAFLRAIAACGAKLLHIHLHSFGESGGITGVAVLAESHMSIHTWPEYDYMALDIFVCGNCNPHPALDALKNAFHPQSVNIIEHKRGQYRPETKTL